MSRCASDDQRFLLGGGGSSGPPPNPPKAEEPVEDDDVIFLPPPPGSLMANVSPSFKLKSFFGPVGRCGDGPSSMRAPSPSLPDEEPAARLAADFCRLCRVT